MNILWVSDEPGWAYDVNAKALSLNMPQHNHHFIYTCQQGPEGVGAIIDKMDVIVAMNPAGFYMYRNFDKVFSILDTVRAIGDSDQNIFPKVKGIICNNQFLFDFAKDQNENILLQPNGLDLNYFKPKQSDREFTMGFAGNINGPYADYKGWTLYQEAMEYLPDVKQESVLYGESRVDTDRMVPDFYHKIDCLILASINEGCSNVITEALACGIPVICTKIGFHGEALEHNKQCLFIERNIESIKSAIQYMKLHSTHVNQMKIQARSFACINHDIKKVAQNYSDFLEKR